LKESSDGETLIAVGIWFRICGAAEEKAQRPKLVFMLGTLVYPLSNTALINQQFVSEAALHVLQKHTLFCGMKLTQTVYSITTFQLCTEYS